MKSSYSLAATPAVVYVVDRLARACDAASRARSGAAAADFASDAPDWTDTPHEPGFPSDDVASVVVVSVAVGAGGGDAADGDAAADACARGRRFRFTMRTG